MYGRTVVIMTHDWIIDITCKLVLALVAPLFTDYLRRRTPQGPQISGAVATCQGAQMSTAVGVVAAVVS
jgi:hypothetical protein